jgi:cytochrome c peroxidase
VIGWWLAGCAVDGFDPVTEDLLRQFDRAQLGEPPAEDPAVLQLGMGLFCDDHLSAPAEGQAAVSCWSCHDLLAGTADPLERAKSVGANGKPSARNALPLLDLAYLDAFGWYGQYDALEPQVDFPLTHGPYGSVSGDDVVAHVLSDHRDAYLAAFPDPDPDVYWNVRRALSAVVRQLTSEPSALDGYFEPDLGLDPMTADERAGARLFVGSAGCVRCHSGPLFTDRLYHDTGVPDPAFDPGRQAVTHDEGDRGRFRSSPLRGVGLTAPYFHTGEATSLDEVVWHYEAGAPGDVDMGPLSLTRREEDQLRAFLESLRGFDPARLSTLAGWDADQVDEVTGCPNSRAWSDGPPPEEP